MKTSRPINPDLGSIAWSALVIDKVHSCADCPIRELAIKQPKSVFARIHNWHRSWWPGWKAHQARACALHAMTRTQA
jgi:hypothetical protein